MVSNVNVIQGKEKDIYFPVINKFREKLYNAILESYKKEREQTVDRSMMQAVEQTQLGGETKKPEMNMVFH